MFDNKEWLLGLALLVLIVFVGVKSITLVKGWADEAGNEISVSGEGEIFVKPDLAKMSFSVVTEDDSVEGALNSNSGKMNGVIDRMKEEGIEDENLKTTSFSIHPRYEYRETGKRFLVGYEVRQTLSVQTKDMKRIGEIISAATNEGANSVGNVRFVVEDDYTEGAREMAIEKAEKKAKSIAEDLDVRLGKVTGFSESSGGPPIFYRAVEGFGDGSPQIETGENSIKVEVTVTYEIK